MAWAATIRVKLAELTLVERILRKIASMKPHAQLCHEFAFVLHRPRREALAAETCRKCLDVDCQRAYAGRLGPRRRAIIGIGHHSSPLSRGKSPVREDGRIMPSPQRSTSLKTIEINRKSSDRRQIARNNPALGIMAQSVRRHAFGDSRRPRRGGNG